LGKTLNAVSHLGAKQFTRCGGPAIGTNEKEQDSRPADKKPLLYILN